jgi:RNA polymerase sigma-70 factor (ECF subfamily)
MAGDVNTDPKSDERSAFVQSAVAQHRASLLRYAARLLHGDFDRAQDVVQDTFVRLVGQEPATVAGHEAEWLFTVCRNRALDYLRKESRVTPFAEGQVERITAETPRPGADVERAEAHAAVLQLLEKLPPNQQEVVRLKFQNGFSYKEISRITSLSVTNVGFILHTALARLRKEMAALPP